MPKDYAQQSLQDGGAIMITLQIKTDLSADVRDSAVDSIRNAITAEINRLEIGLQKTNRHIERFEKEYNISSDVFLNKSAAEDLKNGDSEYVEWSGELKIKERIISTLENLRNLQYVAQ